MDDEKPPGREHDALVRRALEDPATAQAWLKARLPRELVKQLNLSTLTEQPGTFVDTNLRRSETDALFKVQHESGKPVYVYILVEHQSTVDLWLPLRLHKYHNRIWDRERLQRRLNTPTLSPIVSAVLHHGDRDWTPSRQFEDLYNEEVRSLPDLCRFGYILVELTGMQLEETRGDAYARAMEMLLMDHRRQQVERLLQLLPPLILTMWATPGGRDKKRTLMAYIDTMYGGIVMKVLTAEVEKYRERYGSQGITPEDVTLLKFLEERYAREGKEQGILQGRIATVEDMLERGASWETVTQLTGVDKELLNRLREELDGMQEGRGTHDA